MENKRFSFPLAHSISAYSVSASTSPTSSSSSLPCAAVITRGSLNSEALFEQGLVNCTQIWRIIIRSLFVTRAGAIAAWCYSCSLFVKAILVLPISLEMFTSTVFICLSGPHGQIVWKGEWEQTEEEDISRREPNRGLEEGNQRKMLIPQAGQVRQKYRQRLLWPRWNLWWRGTRASVPWEEGVHDWLRKLKILPFTLLRYSAWYKMLMFTLLRYSAWCIRTFAKSITREAGFTNHSAL